MYKYECDGHDDDSDDKRQQWWWLVGFGGCYYLVHKVHKTVNNFITKPLRHRNVITFSLSLRALINTYVWV